ncbi:hypothetical protein M8J77_019818 [Diaphorina citri]|nr:hypothetical protein M8J77_019818 [Diaphorina citri]
MLHSSAENSQFGTGFMVKNKYRNNIINFIPASKRIAILKMVFKKKKCTIIQVHAPTSNHKEEEINAFYEEVDTLIQKEHCEGDHILLIGDFNSCIGKKQRGDERIMGNFGKGKRNKSGEILTNFAASQGLKIVNSFFQYNDRWTWKAPNQKTYEIDYILTQKHKTIIKFTIEKNLQFDSDHRLIMIEFNPAFQEKYYDNDNKYYKVKISIESYQTHLKNLLSRENFNQGTVQEMYDRIEEAIKESVTRENNEAGNQGRKYSKKISEATKELIKRREELNKIPNKTPAQKIEHCEIRKLTKRKIREDIVKFEEDVINKIMDSTGSTKKIQKELSNVKKSWISKVKKEDNTMTTNREEIVEEVTKFYERLYSLEERRDEEPITPYIRMEKSEFDENYKIMESEIMKAISEIKKEKAPGNDGITNDLIIYGKDIIAPKLVDLFNRIFYEHEVPKQWKLSKIILIHKKGPKEDVSNYRPISLSSCLYKLYAKIIQKRMRKKIDEAQPPEQAGFRSSFSTTDNLQTMGQLLEKSREYQLELSIAVVDYVKAFDSIFQDSIWKSLKKIDMDDIYIQTLKELYKCKAFISLDRTGREFDVKRGTKQGCPLSAELFNTVLELIFGNIDWEGSGISVNGENITNLRFADDVILIGKNIDELKTMIIKLREESLKHGLHINMNKTNILTKEEVPGIMINGEEIKKVNECVYLGQLISCENVVEREVERRIKIGWSKYWAMKKIFKSMKLNKQMKIKALKMCIFPAILYGSQTWAPTKKIYKKLDVTQYKMFRSILNIRRIDKISNITINSIMKMKDLSKEAKKLKWRWAGHVTRMKNDRWAKKMTEWIPRSNKRKRGRCRTRWCDEIKKEIGPHWQSLGRDRESWDVIVKQIS